MKLNVLKKQEEWYSGKKKKHTIKTQIIADAKTLKIYSIAKVKGSVHDFKLFKETYIGISNKIKILGNSGYQGINKIHTNSETPKKASKLHPLTEEEISNNIKISKERIFIEHINSHIKKFKIMSSRYRNKRKKHGVRMSLICGIYNYELI